MMIQRTITGGLLAWVCGSMALAAEGQDGKTPSPLAGRRLQQDLILQQTRDEATYVSPWLKVSFSLARPQMTFLSVDATGNGRHPSNLLKSAAGAGPMFVVPPGHHVPMVVVGGIPPKGGTTSASGMPPKGGTTSATSAGNVVRYSGIKLGDAETDALEFTVGPKTIRVVIQREIPHDYTAAESSPLRVMFDATVTPASPLGRLAGPGKLQFPVLLHFPDWGSLLLRAKDPDGEPATWDFSLFRDLKPISPGAVASWRPMTPEERKKFERMHNRYLLRGGGTHAGPEQIQLALHKGFAAGKQRAGHQRIELEMTVSAVYPEAALGDADPRLLGVKRAWLNIFGFRADLGCLANNCTGDTCQFCMHC